MYYNSNSKYCSGFHLQEVDLSLDGIGHCPIQILLLVTPISVPE